jgi:hypothetical protein
VRKKVRELIVPQAEREREIRSLSFFLTISPNNNVPSGEAPDVVEPRT